MSGCCLAGVEQNFGEGCGEVGRGWAEQWACLGRIGQSPKTRDVLKERVSKNKQRNKNKPQKQA